MFIKTAKNTKSNLQKKKWKQREWLDGKESSIVDISSLAPAFPNLDAKL